MAACDLIATQLMPCRQKCLLHNRVRNNNRLKMRNFRRGQVAQIARCSEFFLESWKAALADEIGDEERGPAEKTLYGLDRRGTLKNGASSDSITEKTNQRKKLDQ